MSPQQPAARVGATLWKGCKALPLPLGETCVAVDASDVGGNFSLSVELDVANHTFVEPLVGDSACLDDASLLELLGLIPALHPFIAIIHKIIALKHFIPAEVLSECITLSNTTLIPGKMFSSCARLDSQLLCLDRHGTTECVYKNTDDFGCFEVPLTAIDFAK